MTNVQSMKLEFIKDESGQSASRSAEVLNLIAQMIELSHKRGRPSKGDEVNSYAA